MSTQKSRAERIYEDRLETFFDPDDGPIAQELGEEKAKEWHKRNAESTVETENENFWVLYRAIDEMSQSDVKEVVDPWVEVSQSTVSRVIREKEKSVLTDEESLSALPGYWEEEILDADIVPGEVLEAYRQILAEAHVDFMALREISTPEQPTPEWAARRLPELVGIQHKTAKLQDWDEIADESHLNRLDSVNTDKWK